ncbi:MAG: DUF3048 domain-containing protein [Clostridia bacterium]|nr:DUF3048 domain-containing protein [Clostridia bacterium]
MKKLCAAILCLIYILLLCSACSPKSEPVQDGSSTVADTGSEPVETGAPDEQDDKPEPEPEPEPDPEPEPEPDDTFVPDGNVNPLTGLCDGISDEALHRRPVSIMVSNSYDSLPQWGVSKADIIYEMLAEGRITRLLAIFKDPAKIERIASIRSSRPYFIDIAQSYGAVYLHFGGSVPAYSAIAARSDLINLDGTKGSWEGTLYFRDADRKRQLGSVHSVYTTGEYVEKALAKLKSPLELEDDPSAFNFSERHSAAEGLPAEKVQVTFSSRHMPYYTYDAESGNYLRFQYDEPHMDAWHKQQISVKNLLVLRMELRDVPNSDLHLVEITTTGSGKGYYFCDGKYTEITWEKEKYNSPIRFYTADGSELVCARGQTFVSVVSKTASIYIDGAEQ